VFRALRAVRMARWFSASRSSWAICWHWAGNIRTPIGARIWEIECNTRTGNKRQAYIVICQPQHFQAVLSHAFVCERRAQQLQRIGHVDACPFIHQVQRLHTPIGISEVVRATKWSIICTKQIAELLYFGSIKHGETIWRKTHLFCFTGVAPVHTSQKFCQSLNGKRYTQSTHTHTHTHRFVFHECKSEFPQQSLIGNGKVLIGGVDDGLARTQRIRSFKNIAAKYTP